MLNLRLSAINCLWCLPLMLFAAPAVAERYDALSVCELSAAGGRLTTEARCGELSVPENPNLEADEGNTIELAYAVLPARDGQGLPDPVFFLAGGPGQSARDMAPIMARALRDIHAQRDLVFLDQRGTGGSNRLDCLIDEDGSDWLNPAPELAANELLACLQDWSADVRHYTTTEAANDIERLRAHLGFETINLIGGSYGTRLGQVYLKHHPDRVRTATLDGVVPMRLALGAEHGPNLDRALLAIIAMCQDDAACRQAFPDLDEAFVSLKQAHPSWVDGPKITITHPRLGEALEMTFSRTVLATALRFLAYDPASQMMLPYLIHEAAVTERPERLASQAVMVSEQMSDAIALGLNFAVGCAEDWPQWPDTTETEQTLLGDSVGDLYAQVCPKWPSADVPDDFNAPYTGSTPLLLLSGELDPVTPPSYGDEVDSLAGNSTHLVAAGRGHIVVTMPCMAKIAAQFIDEASVDDLDSDCMDAMGHEPFFTDLLGPNP